MYAYKVTIFVLHKCFLVIKEVASIILQPLFFNFIFLLKELRTKN